MRSGRAWAIAQRQKLLAPRGARCFGRSLTVRCWSLRRPWREFDNFEVVQGDVLALDLAALCREVPVRQGGRLRKPAVLHHDPAITTMESGAFELFSRSWCRRRSRSASVPPEAHRRIFRVFRSYVQYHAKAEILSDVPAGLFVPRRRWTQRC